MSSTAPAQRLQLDLSKYEKLDALQAGHIRHTQNLVSQLDGQWNHMGGQESLQEYFDSYRYQLATMTYAVSLAHYHRLPAARSIFKPLIRQLIHKMLLPDVWAYWYNSSQSGSLMDPGRTELRPPCPDPVCKENIMYSGHLLLMTSLYAMLFDDDEFEKSGSLTFRWEPMFWGLGPQKFEYDNGSLQEIIVKEMEQNGWVGVCCEPNAVFIVCNQYPLIAVRYNDVRNGTDKIEPMLKRYKAAWDKKGMVTPEGLYVNWLFLRQGQLMPPMGIGLTAWRVLRSNAFLNSWNSDLVQSLYERQALGYITAIGDEVRLQRTSTANEICRMVQEDGADPSDASVLARAQEAAPPTPAQDGGSPLAYVLLWLSEVGRKKELEGLLGWLDARKKHTWEKGGLFYPRDDTEVDEEGCPASVGTLAGNACAAYARLNVPDGQRIMWEKPWTSQYLAGRPFVGGVELSQGVDCLRGAWDEEASALVLTVRTWDAGRTEVIGPTAENLSEGQWAAYVDGELRRPGSVEVGGSMSVEVEIGPEEVDVVFTKVA